MKKEGVLLIIVLIIILMTLFTIKGKEITGEVVTGESITGEASSQETNVSIFILPATSNNNPVLGAINSTIYVCERTFLNYPFNITDTDGDNLSLTIFPEDPFFVDPDEFKTGATTVTSNIISGLLGKTATGGINVGSKTHPETITVTDNFNSTCCLDNTATNIVVIEINNAPTIENIGVQTVWTQGDLSTFYHVVKANDTEYDGGYGERYFNMTIVNATSGTPINLFTISSNGIMNFIPTPSQVGIYNVSVCVNDTSLTAPHINISMECGQDGSSTTVCNNFSLTVTNENRAPEILNYFPLDLTPTYTGTTQINFNITKYDSDGTIPDSYWYVDGIFQNYGSGNPANYFNHTFACGVSGVHTVKVEITDGLLNDSLQWNVTVDETSCPPSEAPPEGGETPSEKKYFTVDKNNISVKLNQGQSKVETITITNQGEEPLLFTLTHPNLEMFMTLSEAIFEISAGTTKTIIIDFTAQETTLPDLYLGELIVDGGGTKKKIPISIEVESKEILFDVHVEIPEEYLPIEPGKELVANITITNVGDIEEANITMEYIIMDSQGNQILLESETITIREKSNFLKTFQIPKNLVSGRYVLYVRAIYEGEVGSSSTWFWFSPLEEVEINIMYLIWGFIIIIFLIILIIILKKRRDKKKQEMSPQGPSAFRPQS